jgi:hypothetical protein
MDPKWVLIKKSSQVLLEVDSPGIGACGGGPKVWHAEFI